jgi:hypothetical protein
MLTLAAAATLVACATPSQRPEKMRATKDFTFPWSTKKAPRTDFQARIADGKLSFTFDCEDRDLVVSREWRGESTLDGEDRVEIFFARDPGLARYWCVEIDPQGRVHDYAASHYRKFDSAWDCPGLKTTGTRSKSGYRVTGSIPLETLENLLGKPVTSGASIRVGLFRAEFYGSGPSARGEANDNWLSWVRPSVKTPDFHVPSAFTEVSMP